MAQLKLFEYSSHKENVVPWMCDYLQDLGFFHGRTCMVYRSAIVDNYYMKMSWVGKYCDLILTMALVRSNGLVGQKGLS